MKQERVVAFIVARLGSQRLTAKQLRPIGDRLLLDWVVDRLEQCEQIDEIVLTTPDEPENDRLIDYARERGIGCHRFRGDANDVTGRLREAAEEFGADICILASADCPLLYSEGIDRLVRELRSSPEADITAPFDPPEGQKYLLQGIAVARRRCWQLADDLSDTPELRSNQFPVIAQREHLFKIHNFNAPADFFGPDFRLSVDTWADLVFMTTLFEQLAAVGSEFRLMEVVALLAREPHLLEINAHVRQRCVNDHLRSTLIIYDSNEELDHRRLERCIELALQIVERTSCPVTFLLDDREAKERVESRGLRVAWGALARAAQTPPWGWGSEAADELAAKHDMVIVDLSRGRSLPAGWRSNLAAPVVVLDRSDVWAAEADLVIRCRAAEHDDSNDVGAQFDEAQQARVVGGNHFSILSRELAELRMPSTKKDIDFLIAGTSEEWCQSTAHALEERGWSVRFEATAKRVSSELLARSRVFVSPMGLATYDALALGAIPVAWVRTIEERDVARGFYEGRNFSALILDESSSVFELARVVRDELAAPTLPDDGTSLVIQALVDTSELATAELSSRRAV